MRVGASNEERVSGPLLAPALETAGGEQSNKLKNPAASPRVR